MPGKLLTTALISAISLTLAACGGGAGGGDEGDAEETATRTVEHAMGETEVPENPERVVVLDTGELDGAVALGFEPVGAVRAPTGDGLLSYLEEETENTELVGDINQPNLERIAALEPDLIMSNELRHGEIYDELSEIAPTVFTPDRGFGTLGDAWKENFMLNAETLGKSEEAEGIMADYEARIEGFRGEVGENPPEVSLVRFRPTDTRIYLNDSFAGSVLVDAGLPRPEDQDIDDFVLEPSLEEISLMDGDVMFVSTYGPPEETRIEEFRGNPLWERLEVVRRDDIYTVSDDSWMLGIGPVAANEILDDLETYLVGE